MERAVLPLCAVMALGSVTVTPASAQPTGAAAAAFDLRAVTATIVPARGRSVLRSQAIGTPAETEKPEKTKLRLRYQPEEAGPRFEIGTYGSRKGVMKSRLLHVAMDWSF